MGYEFNRDLYEAAGAADATACSRIGSWGGIEVSWVAEKEVPVTQLRQKMLEELQRRNYSHRTGKTYVRIVRDFAEHFHQPPDKLGPEQIRQYQAHLFQAKQLAPATVSQYVSALRFLFVKTLRRHFLAEYIPFPKSHKRLPTVLSPEEVARLIDSARNLYHRTLLMTLYSKGAPFYNASGKSCPLSDQNAAYCGYHFPRALSIQIYGVSRRSSPLSAFVMGGA